MCLWCMSFLERNKIGTVEKHSNNEQPQSEDDNEKALTERLLKGL